MQQIKFLKDNHIRLGDTIYKGYTVGNLPKSFGFIYDEDKDKEGKSEWFKYKGLTYVPKTELPW